MKTAVCVGDNCIDYYLPPIDQKFVGGNAVNVAIYLQKAGIPTAYVGSVGDDSDGREIINQLQQQHLDLTYNRQLTGMTAQTHIRMSDKGDREFVFEHLGPEDSLVLDQATIDFILQHHHIHNTVLGRTESYLPSFKRSKKGLLSFDYGERYTSDFVDKTIEYVDLAFFSIPESAASSAFELACQMYARGPQIVIVTMGRKGSLVFNGSKFIQSAMEVDVIDTLGAGDSYIGTFLAHWLQGKTISECMDQASKVAAITCTHFGAWRQDKIG